MSVWIDSAFKMVCKSVSVIVIPSSVMPPYVCHATQLAGSERSVEYVVPAAPPSALKKLSNIFPDFVVGNSKHDRQACLIDFSAVCGNDSAHLKNVCFFLLQLALGIGRIGQR